MHQTVGKYMMIAGFLLIAAGLILYISGGRLRWLGHLPGDIRIVRDHFTLFIPVTTMIILSLAITAIIHLIRKMF